MRLTTGFFPSTAVVHVHYAAQAGIFADEGLDVELIPVSSAREQLELWDSGVLTVMHTSPDHLFGQRRRDPVAIRQEGIGELALYMRPDAGATPRFGVDDPASAFALVLRRMLDHSGVPWSAESLIPVGGTRERWAALQEGTIDGTLLHLPFTTLADSQGLDRVLGHFAVIPELATAVVVAAGSDVDTPAVVAYLSALERAERDLVAGGTELVSATLARAGVDAALATKVAADVLAVASARHTTALSAGIAAAADLRRHYDPSWHPARPLSSLVREEGAHAESV